MKFARRHLGKGRRGALFIADGLCRSKGGVERPFEDSHDAEKSTSIQGSSGPRKGIIEQGGPR